MNTKDLGFVTLVVSVSILSFSCSTEKYSESRDEYFRPVSRVVTISAGGVDTLDVLTRYADIKSSDTMRISMIEMIKEQNKRLDAVFQQLNILTQQSAAASANTSLEETLSSHDRLKNETLIEMIRDQNQRLNEVVEQLKFLAENQQRIVRSNLAANVVAPEQQQHPQAIKQAMNPTAAATWANVSLRYGKAIQLYQAGNCTKAIRAFHAILKHHSAGILADRCYFWMGVSHLSLHHTAQAIAALTKVFSFPHSVKHESAYFMLGQCYEQSGTPGMAKAMFKKMMQEFPKSSLKPLAEKKIALLN
jgi:TolA-binding protein